MLSNNYAPVAVYLHILDVLTEKYGHLNGVTSGDEPGNKGKKPKKGRMGDAPGQEVRQWGKAIVVDGKGRPNEFELTLGNGDKVFTHVLWSD